MNAKKLLTPILERHNLPVPFRREFLAYLADPSGGAPEHLQQYIARHGKRDYTFTPMMRECLEAMTAEFLKGKCHA